MFAGLHLEMEHMCKIWVNTGFIFKVTNHLEYFVFREHFNLRNIFVYMNQYAKINILDVRMSYFVCQIR